MHSVERLFYMVCPKCFADIPDTSAFCMECGARLREDTADSLYAEGSDREVYPDIAKANLLRMRKQWEEAADLCIQVLRRFPSNETVHALLGDIYTDQGQYDEAIHWYEMLVDLVPSNAVYRAKLDQLRAMKMAEEAKQTPPALPIDAPEAKRGWAPSQRTWIYMLLGLLSVGLIVSAFVAGMRMNPGDNPPTARTAFPDKPPLTSFATDGGSRQTDGTNQPVKEQDSLSAPDSVDYPATLFLSTQEAMLNRALTQSLPGTPVMGCYNPINGTWTVRGKINGGALSRERALREAYALAEAFYKAMPDVSSLTVIVMVPSQQTGFDELLFAADIPRISPQASLQPMTDEAIRVFFQNLRVWWNPTIPI